jgi:ABC-type branched-subunit amino acid transport system ATPase component/ABC-type branched-subunit amino acid transport system permease subunit
MEKAGVMKSPVRHYPQYGFWHKVSYRAGVSWRSFWAVVVLVVLLCLPLALANVYYLRFLEIAAIYGIAALALALVYGHGGIVSIGHMGLFGLGAYSSAVLALKFGWPVWISMVAALVVSGFGGWLFALSSSRVIGVYLAMTTLAFNIVIERLIIQFPNLTDAAAGMINIPSLNLFGHAFDLESYYYLILLAWLFALYMMRNFNLSSWSSVTQSLRETPVACLFMGNSVPRLRITLFMVSGVMIGGAGALYAHMLGRLNYNSFTWDQSIILLVMVILGGRKELLGPYVGAAVLIYIPLLFGGLVQYMNIVYALILLFFLLVTPEGIVGWIRRKWKERHLSLGSQLRDWKLAQPVYSVGYAKNGGDRPVVEVTGVTKKFGGISALSNVSLKIRAGEIHALIGPNGAGKTTLVNVITGLYPLDGGDVRIYGFSVHGRTADEIARLGVGRTFQQPSLVGEMTTAENMQVATHHRLRAGIFQTLLGLPSHHRSCGAVRAEAIDLLHAVGLGDVADVPVSQLPHGYQRLIEIARALGVHPRLLILDEPAAGLAPEEMSHLLRLLEVVRSNGIATLLIEHNMEFVMSIAERISVLDFGIKIAEGNPMEIQRNEAVLAAYLGE